MTTALTPIEQKTVEFYSDQLTAALVVVDPEAEPTVYVPVRSICENLGVDWSAQRRRIIRDAVLSKNARGVAVTATPGGTQEMLCLPIEFLHGWLFGLNADRVKPELREKVIRYQEECFAVLWRAFRADSLPALAIQREASSLAYVRDMALAIAQMAEQQMAFELRLADSDARHDRTEARLDQAAQVVGALVRDVAEVKRRVAPGNYVTEEQAAEIQLRVKGLAQLLGQSDPAKNHYQGVFGTLYRTFGVTSYKNIPQGRYEEVLTLLEEWRRDVAASLSQLETDA